MFFHICISFKLFVCGVFFKVFFLAFYSVANTVHCCEIKGIILLLKVFVDQAFTIIKCLKPQAHIA